MRSIGTTATLAYILTDETGAQKVCIAHSGDTDAFVMEESNDGALNLIPVTNPDNIAKQLFGDRSEVTRFINMILNQTTKYVDNPQILVDHKQEFRQVLAQIPKNKIREIIKYINNPDVTGSSIESLRKVPIKKISDLTLDVFHHRRHFLSESLGTSDGPTFTFIDITEYMRGLSIAGDGITDFMEHFLRTYIANEYYDPSNLEGSAEEIAYHTARAAYTSALTTKRPDDGFTCAIILFNR